jgi:asparagine synthase (glutamine-hydrolysing)
MCGIIGLVGYEDTSLLTRMNDLITHRGPDDFGELVHGDVMLAMRRLSIIDLAGGHQPMSNETGDVWIVFNGEIYNAPDLRKRLEGRHTFQTASSDTEALIHLYEEKGPDMLADLNGMFTFIIYDQRKNILFGARDHAGIKPLYIHHQGDKLALASELKSLLALPGLQRTIDHTSLSHYLGLRYIPGGNTIWEGVRRLEPGHYFTYDLASRQLNIQQWWSLEFEPDPTPGVDEWVERIREELGAAARRWTLADVPVGCSLSGGLDSTSIVALLSDAGQTVKTYSLGFAGAEDRPYDELHLARQVAQRYGTDHHERIIAPEDLLSRLIDMVWSLDEPYGGGLPSWYVFEFMCEDVTVSLTGSGGDELFGNYGKYWLMERRGLSRVKGAVRQARRWGRLGTGTVAAALAPSSLAEHYEHIYYDPTEQSAFYSNAVDSRMLLAQSVNGAAHPRDVVMAIDFANQLPEEFLFMTDRFSMAHSLEARTPFLDRELIDCVRRIPAEVRTDISDPKYLLRRAVADLLPEDVVKGTKRGFVLPTDRWLREELRLLLERRLGREYLAKQGIFDPVYYDRYVEPHLAGRINNGERIWPMLMFQLWYAVFIEGNAIDRPTMTWQDLA